MILYLDTSALVKRYVVEAGSQEVIALIEQAETVGSAVLTQVEMASALAKAVRLHWVAYSDAQTAWHDFLEHWPAFIRLSVTSVILERASHLAWQHGLRGYDAVHLAAALFWQDTLGDPVTLAAFDRQLWESAQRVGMIVWPESLNIFR
jgi:predicted nucleic acid-binding protein